MSYSLHSPLKRPINWLKVLAIAALSLIIVAALLFVIGSRYLDAQLQSVTSDKAPAQSVSISSGMSTSEIATMLYEKRLIRNEWAFKWYVRTTHAASYLQAGTYQLSPSQSSKQIVSQLTHGKVATELIIISPGLRLDQIRESLINQGYTPEQVDAALEPTQYENMAVLADKPKGNNLEGYLYPDSFQRTADTKLNTIIQQSLLEMDRHLTTDIRKGFAARGLTVYQGITLASIVEKEVNHQSDRAQAAQVFQKRLSQGISLGSDVTAFYGSEKAGVGKSVLYDTPYNTRIHTGLPPTPISNVSASSLDAVAHPANTDWLFFVSGDNGTTYFSKTQAEHEALVKQYCHELCQ